MQTIIRSVALAMLCVVAAANAKDVAGLNSARVPVADRSDTEYKRGIAKALSAVLVKMTGSTAAARSKAGRGIVGQAQRLVQQFGYERTAGSPGSNSSRLYLRVEFDARVLGEEMRARNMVMWGKERPDTLIWLVIDEPNGRSVISTHDDNAISRAVNSRALARGIPVVLPLGDISEASVVSSVSSSAELTTALQTASEKYGVGSSLVGHLKQITPNLWEADWVLQVTGESLRWDQQGDIVALLAEEATDNLADALGRRYASATMTGQSEAVAVTVKGLHSPQDYARTERYLRSLDSVSNLLVRRVDEQGIIFDVTVQGGLRALAQSISFGQTLVPDPGDVSAFHLNAR